MKTILSSVVFIFSLFFLNYSHAADLTLPITKPMVIATVDTGAEEGLLFKHEVVPHDFSGQIYRYYRVGFRLVSGDFSKPLRATASRVDYLPAETVGPVSQEYVVPGSVNWLFWGDFDEALDIEGAEWRYIDTGASAPASFGKSLRTKTEFFIGFRFTGDEGQHYGWMRFTRPDTNFLTFFELTAWNSNPLPDEPIGAGLPPAIPLTPTLTPEELRLAWPVQVWNWILETSESLGPDAVWEPVPDAVGPEVLLTFPETTRFFRVRRP